MCGAEKSWALSTIEDGCVWISSINTLLTSSYLQLSTVHCMTSELSEDLLFITCTLILTSITKGFE